MAEKLNDRAALVAWPMSAVTGDEILNARQKSSVGGDSREPQRGWLLLSRRA
jgi:hypothetical protein